MDVNEHERLSNITLRYTLKYMNCTVIALLHYLITARTLKLSIARTPIKYEINQ